MPITRYCISGCMMLGLVACASSPETFHDPTRPADAPEVLDGSYDPDSWQWERQPDGGFMLVHTRLKNCFVAVDWPMHAFGGEPAPRRYTTRRVHGTSYRVAERELGDNLREVHYRRPDQPTQFSVFGNTECQDLAHEILAALEEES